MEHKLEVAIVSTWYCWRSNGDGDGFFFYYFLFWMVVMVNGAIQLPATDWPRSTQELQNSRTPKLQP